MTPPTHLPADALPDLLTDRDAEILRLRTELAREREAMGEVVEKARAVAAAKSYHVDPPLASALLALDSALSTLTPAKE